MDIFVIYDAQREQAFVRFPGDGAATAESGYLDAGLWVGFGAGDPAWMQLVTVEHPFFARPEGFVERVAALVGPTVWERLRDGSLRDETVVGRVKISGHELEALRSAWDGAHQELRAKLASADPAPTAVGRTASTESVRRWLVLARMEPVVARAVQPTVVVGGFDARIELVAGLADALRVEPAVRVSIADGVLRLRGRVRDGEEPPVGVTLGLADATGESVLAYDADLGEVSAELELSTPPHTLAYGEVMSLLRLQVPVAERTGDG